MNKRVVFVLAFLMVSVSPPLAGAWEYEFGGKVGLVAPSGDLNKEAYGWGFYASREVADNFSLQLGYLRHVHDLGKGPNEFTTRVKADLDLFTNIIDSKVEVNDITLNGVYRFKGESWIPFLSAGIGVYVWNLEVTGDQNIAETTVTTTSTPGEPGTTEVREGVLLVERETIDYFADFGLNLGGGLSYRLTNELLLGGEVSYNYVFGDFDEGYFNILLTLSSGF